jgi:hypothetical protein
MVSIKHDWQSTQCTAYHKKACHFYVQRGKGIPVIKNHALPTYWGVAVKFHAFLTPALYRAVPFFPNSLPGLFQGKDHHVEITSRWMGVRSSGTELRLSGLVHVTLLSRLRIFVKFGLECDEQF